MNIMVVDDEQDIQLLFRQKFRKEINRGALSFYFAFSAEEALESLHFELPNCLVLILADINMPGMNGIEMLKILKKNYPQLKVFMITAYGDEQTYQNAMSNGADDYIQKPIEFEKLKQKIWDL